jgi:hypothetical protein
VKDQDEQLLGEIARRNWIILVLFVLLSLLWRSVPITSGVLGGGLLAVAGYQSLYRSLKRMIANPSSGSSVRFRFGYFFRFAALATALFLLIVLAGVNPVGLLVGLSVVIVNIFWTTIKRSFLARRR